MKKMLCALTVAAFTLSAGTAFAARSQCTVDAVDGDKVTLTCKKANEFKADEEAVLSTKKVIEKGTGC